MKSILLATILLFSIGSLWGQDAPAAPEFTPPPESAAAALEENRTEPEPAVEEGESRWSDFLPLNKEMAGDSDMPLPFGIGVTGYYQSQGMKLNSMSLGIETTGQTEASIPGVEASNIESKVHNYNLRVDGWVLPFLNVYGVIGQIDGKTSVATITSDAALVGAFMAANPWTAPYLTSGSNPLAVGSANLLYEGSVYGGGFILAGEYKQFWGTLDFNLTRTDLDIASSEIDAWTFTPRVGITKEMNGKKTLLWIGAMHQEVDETQGGEWTIPVTGLTDATVNYKVKTEMEEKWNFLVGGSINLTKEMDLAIEGGFGEREQFMGVLTYRF